MAVPLNPLIERFTSDVFAQNNPYFTGDNKSITDEVFLFIQNDHNLMHRYLRLIENRDLGLDKVNQQIGLAVKLHYNLDNDDREYAPKSTLIQSHQRFK